MKTDEAACASDDTNGRLSARTPYAPPRLVALGCVASLTLGPSGSTSKQGPRADGANPFSISRS